MRRLLGCWLAGLLAWMSGASFAMAAVEIFPVKDIRPGMRAVTRTVMKGAEIVELETEILGVQWNGLGVGRHLIIGKLVDEKSELTGAVHGMSGSPMYIDGRLAGALSRRIMIFEKDGHCGFTPIEDMLDVERRKPQGVGFAKSRLLAQPESFGLMGKVRATPHPAGEWLGVPLAVTGWKPEWKEVLSKYWGGWKGLLPVAGGGGASPQEKDFPLKPGSPLAAVLITGDINVAGTGTLTWREGDRIMGFGHPMLELGTTQVPFASAEIITVVPSYYYPHKLSNTGRAGGVMLQDRLSAVSGVWGKLPPLATYRITRTHNGEARPEMKGQFVQMPELVPGLLGMMFSVPVFDSQDTSAFYTVRLNGELKFRGLPPLRFQGVYSGGSKARFQAVVQQLERVSRLYQRYEKQLVPESFSLNVESREQSRRWKLVDSEAGKPRYQKGEPMRVRVRLESDRGEVVSREVELALPGEIPEGEYRVRVRSGMAWERERQGRVFQAGLTTPSGAIRGMNVFRSHRACVVELVSDAPGIVASGKEQSLLPPSVIDILQGRSPRPAIVPLAEKVWAEGDVMMEEVVSGEDTFKLEIRQ